MAIFSGPFLNRLLFFSLFPKSYTISFPTSYLIPSTSQSSPYSLYLPVLPLFHLTSSPPLIPSTSQSSPYSLYLPVLPLFPLHPSPPLIPSTSQSSPYSLYLTVLPLFSLPPSPPLILSTSQNCTDGNTVFGCDSYKNSLVIIYMF